MTHTERIPKLPLLDKVVLSMNEACAIGGMGLTSMYHAIKTGRLPARKKGKRVVILRKDLDQFIENLPRMGGREKVES